MGGWEASHLSVLKLLLFPCELEERGGSCIVQMEIQLQLAKRGTASGTPMSSRGSLSPLPLQAGHRFQPGSLVLTELFCGVSTGRLWGAGAAAAGDFWSSYCRWRGHWAVARSEALHPCGLEQDALLGAAAKALGSCLALAEIIVEFADSARRELNTCSQVVCVSHQYSCWLWKTCKGFHLL